MRSLLPAGTRPPRLARPRRLRALASTALALAALALLGCTGDTACFHVGESCTFSCCLSEGLQCRSGPSGGYCTKTCHCHGSALCAPSSFNDGCPQGSVCLATQTDGTGECVVLCDSPPCDVGRYRCAPERDGGAITCGTTDAGVPDLAVTVEGG